MLLERDGAKVDVDHIFQLKRMMSNKNFNQEWNPTPQKCNKSGYDNENETNIVLDENNHIDAQKPYQKATN